MKLLSKQTNTVGGHSNGAVQQEKDTGDSIQKIIFYMKSEFT